MERLHRVLPAIILFHEMLGRPIGAQEVVRLLLDMLHACSVPVDDEEDVGSGDPTRAPGTDAAVKPTTAATSPTGSSAASLLALVLAALRHFDQALEHWERTDSYQQESLEIAQKLPDSQEKAFTLLLNSMGPGILTSRQSVDLCQQCLGIFNRLGNVWGTALAQLVLADAANFGDVDAELTRRSYQASLEDFTRLGNEWGRALCLTGLADVERRAGHLEEAYQIGYQSLDTYCRMGDTWRAVFTRQTLGEIAAGLGRFEEARRHFEANLAYFARIGDNHQRDLCRERLQHLDEHAGSLALDLPQDLLPLSAGIQQEEESTPAYSVALSTPEPPALADALVERLSARELEVLHLLAEGLTNREIAQRLYLSPNTVRVHTFHIYDKLGVNNRTQAVARARVLALLTSS
jgi:DNA-binding CsgD family transcriptional regulator